MRSASRQPIYLAQLKKRDKENIITKQQEQCNLEYDLKVFQESLYMGNHIKNIIPESRGNKNERKPMMECANQKNISVSLIKQTVKDNMVNSSQQYKDSTATFFKKYGFTKKQSRIKNLHQTQVSYKPHMARSGLSARNADNDIKNVESQLVSKDQNMVLCESYKIGVVDKIVCSSQCCSVEEINRDGSFDKRTEILKKSYEEKIEELQMSGLSKQKQISYLQTMNNIHKQEKANLLMRIDHIQQEMNQILSNNQLFNEESKQQIIYQNDSCQTQILNINCQIQTQQLQVKDQIFEPQISGELLCMSAISEDLRNSSEYSSQDWILKAKALKCELQYQKTHSNNLEIQFKILLQNNEIEWRQKVGKLTKQLQVLNGRYESKCAEVREKESLINRLIANK